MHGAKKTEKNHLRNHIASILEHETCPGTNATQNTLHEIRTGAIGTERLMNIVKTMAHAGCGTQVFHNVTINPAHTRNASLPAKMHTRFPIPKSKHAVFDAVLQGISLATTHRAVPKAQLPDLVRKLRAELGTRVLQNASLQRHVRTSGTPAVFSPTMYNIRIRNNAAAGPGELKVLAKITNVEIHVYVRKDQSYVLRARYPTLTKSGRVHVIRLVDDSADTPAGHHYDVLVHKLPGFEHRTSKRAHFWGYVNRQLFDGNADLGLTNGMENVGKKIADNRIAAGKRARLDSDLPTERELAPTTWENAGSNNARNSRNAK